jgi:hypothetical protein
MEPGAKPLLGPSHKAAGEDRTCISVPVAGQGRAAAKVVHAVFGLPLCGQRGRSRAGSNYVKGRARVGTWSIWVRNLRRVRLLKDRIAAAVGPPQGIGSLLPVLEEYEQIGSINAVAFPLCMYPTWSRLSCFAVGRDPVRPDRLGSHRRHVRVPRQPDRRRPRSSHGSSPRRKGSRWRQQAARDTPRRSGENDSYGRPGRGCPLAQPGLAPSITHQISRAYEPHRRVRKRPTRVVP